MTEFEKQMQKLKDTIISVIREFPNANKGVLVTAIMNRTGIGKTRVNTEIQNLIRIGAIVAAKGAHNSTLLSLSDDFEDLEGDS